MFENEEIVGSLAGGFDWAKAKKCAVQTCVEVKRTPGAVYVRDSKQVVAGEYTILSSTHSQWREFLTLVSSSPASGSAEPFGFETQPNGDVALTGAEGTLSYDADEWSAFLEGVRDGDFDLQTATVAS